MMSRFVRPIVVASLIVTSSLALNLVFAPASSAQLRSALHLVAGEDPSAPGAVASGDARFQLPDRLRVTVTGMDPARFPADASCNAEVRIGALSAKGIVPILLPVGNLENPFPVAITVVDFRATGIGHAGDQALMRLRCEFVVGGVRQRHETQWAGTL